MQRARGYRGSRLNLNLLIIILCIYWNVKKIATQLILKCSLLKRQLPNVWLFNLVSIHFKWISFIELAKGDLDNDSNTLHIEIDAVCVQVGIAWYNKKEIHWVHWGDDLCPICFIVSFSLGSERRAVEWQCVQMYTARYKALFECVSWIKLSAKIRFPFTSPSSHSVIFSRTGSISAPRPSQLYLYACVIY